MEGLSVCLLVKLHAWLGRTIAKASELALCFRGVFLEGGPGGFLFQLDIFKMYFSLAGSFKLPSQALMSILGFKAEFGSDINIKIIIIECLE